MSHYYRMFLLALLVSTNLLAMEYKEITTITLIQSENKIINNVLFAKEMWVILNKNDAAIINITFVASKNKKELVIPYKVDDIYKNQVNINLNNLIESSGINSINGRLKVEFVDANNKYQVVCSNSFEVIRDAFPSQQRITHMQSQPHGNPADGHNLYPITKYKKPNKMSIEYIVNKYNRLDADNKY